MARISMDLDVARRLLGVLECSSDRTLEDARRVVAESVAAAERPPIHLSFAEVRARLAQMAPDEYRTVMVEVSDSTATRSPHVEWTLYVHGQKSVCGYDAEDVLARMRAQIGATVAKPHVEVMIDQLGQVVP